MPKFPKPCVDCGVVTLESRCPEHKLADRRPSTARRGNTTERDKRRRRTLRRFGFQCASCGVVDKTAGSLDVDHILPLERGGDHADENLQVLCRPCHSVKTRAEAADRRASQ
jgi:5-methylcytosine-specific restriction protein A